MKSKFTIIGFLAVFALALAVPGAAQSRLGFKFGGGLGYVGGGDINTGLQGYADYFHDLAALMGFPSEGGYKPFHFGLDINGELLFQVTPQVAVGLGAGYLAASRSSSTTFHIGSTTEIFSWKPQASAIPITLNFHYFIPAGERLKFVVHAGVGYYLAKLDFEEVMEGDTLNHDLSGNGFGAHGGVGIELGLSPNASLIFDLLGRYAVVGELKGDVSYPGGTATNGTMWYFEADTGFGIYKIVEYDTDTPGGGTLMNVRKAKLDFSGFSAVLGFLFRF